MRRARAPRRVGGGTHAPPAAGQCQAGLVGRWWPSSGVMGRRSRRWRTESPGRRRARWPETTSQPRWHGGRQRSGRPRGEVRHPQQARHRDQAAAGGEARLDRRPRTPLADDHAGQFAGGGHDETQARRRAQVPGAPQRLVLAPAAGPPGPGADRALVALDRRQLDAPPGQDAVARRRRAHQEHRHAPCQSGDRHAATSPTSILRVNRVRPACTGAYRCQPERQNRTENYGEFTPNRRSAGRAPPPSGCATGRRTAPARPPARRGCPTRRPAPAPARGCGRRGARSTAGGR